MNHGATRSARLLLALSFLSVACNKVFGLDEGTLDPYATTSSGGGGAASGGSGDGGANGSSVGSFGGSGGECLLQRGMENGDFALRDAEGPLRWSEYSNEVDVATDHASGLDYGLRLTMPDVGPNGFGGLYQVGSMGEWSECVRIRGSSRRVTGTGRMVAQAVFGTRILEVEVPSSSQFESFEATCDVIDPIYEFNVRYEIDQIPEGTTTTYESLALRFDHVCCDGTEAPCDSL